MQGLRLFLTALLFSNHGLAASVQNIKNEKMLVDLAGQSAKPGDQFFLLDSAGKKKAVIRIRQTKDNRAIAELVKGVPAVGYKLSEGTLKSVAPPKPAAPKKLSYVPLGKSYSPVSSRSGQNWGVMGSLLMSEMQVDFIPSGSSTKTSVLMKGTSFGALGMYDYAFSPELEARGLAGLEMFQVTGSSAGATDCDNSSTCNVNITYLSTYGVLKYNFYNTRDLKAWAGGFYGFLFALSKASSVLKSADISTNQLYGFSGGIDYPLKQKNAFIPVSFDYGFFPSSNTVKAKVMFLRTGWATSF